MRWIGTFGRKGMNATLMTTKKGAFFCGTKAVVPIILGIIPFAMIAGISAIKVGMTQPQALGMSYIVFAGAAQLAAIDLMGRNAHIAIIILTALIINLRFFMYSASLAPHFQGVNLRRRSLLAYLLTDQAYAVSISAFDGSIYGNKPWYYLGAAFPLWVVWQASTAAGVFLGTHIPHAWSLDFAIPLTFLALLFPAIRNRPSWIAAISAGVLAIAGHQLPYQMGLLMAAIGGVAAGYLAERRQLHAD